MPKVTINQVEYDLDTMTEESKSLLVSLQFVDNELQRIKATQAVLATARASYSNALSSSLGLDTTKTEAAETVPQNISFE